jgi:hypothetical protein
MSIAPTFNDAEPAPIEMDPRHCGECGLTIDRHERVDTDEGPEFLCIDFSPDELTLEELERRAELRRQEEVAAMVERMERADPRDCWRHTGEPPPPIELRNGPIETALPRAPEPYRPASSTVSAFRYLIAAGDVARIREWLADRPKDAPHLLALLEGQDHA